MYVFAKGNNGKKMLICILLEGKFRKIIAVTIKKGRKNIPAFFNLLTV
jgi:hypothetical protein